MNTFFLLHFSIFLVSFAPLFAKLLPYSALFITWGRSGIAFIVLFLLLAWKKQIKTSWNILGWNTLSGVFLAMHWWFYFISIQYSGVAIGVILLFTAPIFSAFIEPWYNKTPFMWKSFISAGLITLGVFFLTPQISLENTTTQGILLGLLSAFLYSLRNIFTKTHTSSENAFTTLAYQLLLAFLFLSFPVFYTTTSFPIPSFSEIYILGILSIVFTIGAHGLIIKTLQHFSATTFAITSGIGVLYSSLFSFFLFAEKPSHMFYIGSICIFSAILFHFWKR